jgi:hypothetical protein
MPDIRERSGIFALMARAGKQLNGAVVAHGKLGKARLHRVHCANPGAAIGAMDFNGAWKNSYFREGTLAQK